jgi:hypothetical protein
VDPAPAHARFADRELVVMHVNGGCGVLLHHPAQTPGGEVGGGAGVGVAVRLREFDPDEVLRALPI